MYNKFQQVYDYYGRVFRKIQLDTGTPPKNTVRCFLTRKEKVKSMEDRYLHKGKKSEARLRELRGGENG